MTDSRAVSKWTCSRLFDYKVGQKGGSLCFTAYNFWINDHTIFANLFAYGTWVLLLRPSYHVILCFDIAKLKIFCLFLDAAEIASILYFTVSQGSVATYYGEVEFFFYKKYNSEKCEIG